MGSQSDYHVMKESEKILKLLKVKVPTGYDPDSRQYNFDGALAGDIWDGTFQDDRYQRCETSSCDQIWKGGGARARFRERGSSSRR